MIEHMLTTVYPEIMKYSVRVKPGSRHVESVALNDQGELEVKLRAAPVDGAANKALIKILAKHFRVSKSQVVIKSGFTAKIKIVQITENPA